MHINQYPILEFDEDRNPMINPSKVFKKLDVSEGCVLCFFGKAIETILREYPHRIVARFKAESMVLPIYEIEYKGKKLGLIQAGVGAPIAAAQIEELSALGYSKFIACGSCGVLDKDIVKGHLIIPTSAIRDEGTSYHYAAPSREIDADPKIVSIIEQAIAEQGVPYIKARTWTTDAFYRETRTKVKQRKEEGCVTVEMEASAYFAVARYNNVEFGQILYAGDNLGSDEWDSRSYTDCQDVRELVLRISMDAALKL